MKSEFYIWATSRYSLWELSQALRKLNVSHTIEGAKKSTIKSVDLGFKQPREVHLTSRVDGYKAEAVNFISASVGALADTNFRPFPDSDLNVAIRAILTEGKPIRPQIVVRDAANYVESLARPSLLNKIQTEINRIQPYALRKQTQVWVLEFFNNEISLRELRYRLERSTKTEALFPIVKEGVSLRDAVVRLKRESVTDVAAATGHSAFELMYLIKANRST